MKRFYNRSIHTLKNECNLLELAEDIDSYVNHLELVKAILIQETSLRGDPLSKRLLQQFGYKTE